MLEENDNKHAGARTTKECTQRIVHMSVMSKM